MTMIEGIALTLAGLILLETFILIVAPRSLLSLARSMARYRYPLMIVYLVLGFGLLYLLLQRFSLAEIMASGIVIAIFYGVILMPYYEPIVEEFEADYDQGTLWSKMSLGLLVWIGLAVGVIVEWLYL